MVIKINLAKCFWTFVLLLVIGSYPVNWAMMRNGVGWYNNDPNYEWLDHMYDVKKMKGPNTGYRTTNLILSPIMTPLNMVYWIAKTTHGGV